MKFNKTEKAQFKKVKKYLKREKIKVEKRLQDLLLFGEISETRTDCIIWETIKYIFVLDMLQTFEVLAVILTSLNGDDVAEFFSHF